jgi:putative flippase GtrA
MIFNKLNILSVLLLVLLLGSITIELQSWVGDSTIYSAELESKRGILHDAILANTPPGGGSWSDVGAAALNIRVGTVFLAEVLHQFSGLAVAKVYKLLDTVFLFCALIGLFFYLRKWLTDIYCLIGVLFFSAMLPVTYYLHLFQPWDRIQLAIWILLLYLVRERQILLFGFFLAVSIIIKFDTILLPGLYFMVYVSAQDWRKVTVESAILFVLAVGVYLMLKHLLPTPLEPARFGLEGVLRQIPANIQAMVSMNIRHPPLLVHTVPILLIISGFRRWSGDRFISASVLFAIGMMVIWFLFTVFAEVRTQLAALVLVLPAALLSLQKLIDPRQVDSMTCTNRSIPTKWLKLSTKLFRFGIVGLVNAIIYAFSTSIYISEFGFGVKIASIAGFCTALPLAFFAHKSYTFASQGLLVTELHRFIITQTLSLLVSVFAMSAAVDYFGLHYYVGIFGAIILVPFMVFLILDNWVFCGDKQVRQDQQY